jgi:hypothetical protein
MTEADRAGRFGRDFRDKSAVITWGLRMTAAHTLADINV